MPIHKLKCVARSEVAKNTITLTFEKPEGFTFIPGQYGGFTLLNPKQTDAGGITRRFSLLGTPDDDHLKIVTRIQASAFKQVLNTLRPDDEIKFAGPSGSFTLHENIETPAVMIAGGMGIAPFYSMIRHALKHEPTREIILFYGNNTEKDSAFIDELNALSKDAPHFKVIHAMVAPEPTWQGETGFITDALIKKHVKDLSLPIFYICGAPIMVNALHETLQTLEVDEARIKTEDFPGY